MLPLCSGTFGRKDHRKFRPNQKESCLKKNLFKTRELCKESNFSKNKTKLKENTCISFPELL